MARLTAAERQSLKDLTDRAEAEDEANAADELWVRTKDGNEVKLTGAKAAAYRRKHQLEADDEPEDGDGQEDELEPDDAPEKETYFARKPKKAAAAK